MAAGFFSERRLFCYAVACRLGRGNLMGKSDESVSPSWSASFFMQTTEDVTEAVVTTASAATTANSSRPSVVFSSKDDCSSPLKKLQHQVSRLMKGFSPPPQEKTGTYNPEVLTSQKRQWASLQLQSLFHKILREPSQLFESMVVVGLHPNCDIQALQQLYFARKYESSGRFRSSLHSQYQACVGPNLEPQVLFVYPPDKQLPLKYKDLLSFCFPGGVEVNVVERTPSMSELNEILLGQEHLKQSDLSFVFRLQVADNSTLYGCCVLAEELVQKPSSLISMISDGSPPCSPALGRHTLTTHRCYCILSRRPFFELHFGVLNSIFTEEKLDWLTRSIGHMTLDSKLSYGDENLQERKSDNIVEEHGRNDVTNVMLESSKSSTTDSVIGRATNEGCHMEQQVLREKITLSEKATNDNAVILIDPEEKLPARKQIYVATQASENCDSYVDEIITNKQPMERRLPNAVLPLLRYQQYESSESTSSFQGSPSEDRSFRSDVDEAEMEEASFSGQEDFSDHIGILEWAKANNHGTLRIICEYYQLPCPTRGSTIKFHPLEHLHPLEFHRHEEAVLHISGSTIDMKLCNTSLELVEAHQALLAEEEADALSVWTVACICGYLRLEHVLTFIAGSLLEKQLVVVCSNLGILSASVLSIIPLIRPYQWQSLLMPALPNDMLDFLDAPVPYIVGVKNRTTEVQSKLTNVILVDLNKNQVKSPTIPSLPKQKELYSALSPFHAKLVGESFLGRKRPVYDCTDVQVEAAKGFLSVLRSYLDSLCSNLRSHTITNVQSNEDKVSLLLKESFIESFPARDRPFMKHFLDTQLFSVHTDLVLSFFQKD